jgi:hypothetical protein
MNFGRMGKEVIMANFKVLFKYCMIEENHKNPVRRADQSCFLFRLECNTLFYFRWHQIYIQLECTFCVIWNKQVCCIVDGRENTSDTSMQRDAEI